MERKIGEVFEHQGVNVKVVATEFNNCDNCCFLEENAPCSRIRTIAGECLSRKRTDKKSVIFMEAKDEQPQKLNLCEILKNCPQGGTFWSPLLGDVKFYNVNQRDNVIYVTTKALITWKINADGTITIDDITSEEVMLYPSKEQRDWSKFTSPWYKKEESIKPKFKVGDRIRHKETNKNDVYEISKVYDDSYGIVGFNWGIYMKYQDQYELVSNKFDPKTLKPFDRVLSRYDGGCWSANLFSHIEERDNEYCAPFSVCNGSWVKFCIPYNDDTKHLVGTKEEAPEYYRYWED